MESGAAAPLGITACHIAADLLEEELFGLASEAGSDAPPERIGRIVFCQGGTLVLDEIASLPPSIQPKIERLLNENQYERRDDFRVREADVRIVATTSVDLSDAVRRQRFRRELQLALDVVRIDIPPLRERPEDIRPLAEKYLAYYNRQASRNMTGFTNDALNALERHNWPGNQRELRNLVERAVILCPSDTIELKHFPPNFLASSPTYLPGDLVPLEMIEDLHIRGVLAAAGTVKGAASILGINYSTLWRRLKRNANDAMANLPAEAPASLDSVALPKSAEPLDRIAVK